MTENNGLKMKYFVLKPAGNDVYAKASRMAMRSYAHYLKKDDAENNSYEHQLFADDLIEWAGDEEQIAALASQDDIS